MIKCPDETWRFAVLTLCGHAGERVTVDDGTMKRATALRSQGLRDMDALHLACAERGGAEVLLTIDDAFLSAAGRLRPASSIRVVNPVMYETEVFR